MQELNIPGLVEYLVTEDDFIKTASGILKECSVILGVNELSLMQISRDCSKLTMIAGVDDKNDMSDQESKEIVLADLPWLGAGVCEHEGHNGGHYIYVPIFIRKCVAMYVRSFKPDGRFAKEQVQLLTQVALVLQNIAARKNFEDSLENSYRLLRDILDYVPTGIAVLDRDNKNVLLMNRLTVQSEAMQNAIGCALSKYNESGKHKFENIYDNNSGLWFDVDFTEMDWVGGEHVLMGTVLDITQKVKERQRVEYQANNDYLTGLFNRMKCERDLRDEIDKTVNDDKKGVLIYLDLDDFKQVNDGLGHQYGDVLLQEISAGLRSIEAISRNCYRMGGDEFVIIVKHEAFNEINAIVDSICNMFNSPWELMGTKYYCTMSMGLVVFPDDGTHVHDVLQKADYAMYEAKKGGKNRYLWYEETDRDSAGRTELLMQKLKESVESDFDGFDVRYYPIVDDEGKLKYVGSNPVFICEELGKLESSQFMETAEYNGLGALVADFLMENVCCAAAKWSKKYGRNIPVIVNVLPVQLLASGATEKFANYLTMSGANRQDIIVCVSETAEFRDEKKALAMLEYLKKSGFGIAISDFICGNMSLERILKYGAELVLTGNPSDSADERFLNGVIGALKELSVYSHFDICVTGCDNITCKGILRPADASRTYTCAEFEKEWLE